MRTILIGYGEMMRALALGILKSNHSIAGVLLNDSIGRNAVGSFVSNCIKPSEDYLFAKAHKLNIINAKSANSKEFQKAVKNLKADIVITGSWSEKLSIQTLNILPNAFVNVHPSLLPKYRGPNPYIQNILNAEKQTGVTFHLMDVNYDTGAVLYQKKVPVLNNDTGGSLKLRCCAAAQSGIVFLLDNFPELVKNQTSQIESESSYQPQISLKETIIEFKKESAADIDKRIRALAPWLKCYIPFKNEFFSFDNYKIIKELTAANPGTIIRKSSNSVYVACLGGGVMKFSELKIKRPFSKYLSKFYWDKLIKENTALD